MRDTLKIVVFSFLAAIIYGILHDMVTAHICVEYFTIAHPYVIDSKSPVMLALVWGVLATWWVGLALGMALAGAARLGGKPPVSFAQLRNPIIAVMAVSALCAVLAAWAGAVLSAIDVIHIAPRWEDRIAPDRHGRFLTVAWAHSASYLAGALAGVTLIWRTWRRRRIQVETAR